MKRLKFIIILTVLFAIAPSTYCQSEQAATGFNMTDLLIYCLVFFVFLMLIVVINELMLLRRLIKKIRRQMVPSASLEPEPEEKSLWDRLSGLSPMSKEGELIMADHEYDGINELDNGMPPWLQGIFGITILFAVMYFTYYIVLEKGMDQHQEYRAEMQIAEEQRRERLQLLAASIDESNVVALTEPFDLNEGKKLFINYCATCHGNNAEGKDGPNLTDQYWIHGGGINNIFKTIKYGVPFKGMVAWQEHGFDPLMIQRVASYIISLEGSNPTGGLPPAGNLWTGEEVSDSTQMQ